MKKKILILGGGLAGLSAAEILSNNCDVTILEKSNQVGGLAGSFTYENKRIPMFYHHVFQHDFTTLRFIEEFGDPSGIVWNPIKMCIAVKKKLYKFTDPISLLKFDYLSFWARIRYGLFGLYVFTLMNPDKIDEKLQAKEWLYRFAGKEVTDKLFHQLYSKNKFNIPLTRISAKQFAHRLKAKEALGVFTFPPKGLDPMLEGLEKKIKKNGRVITSAQVVSVDVKSRKIVYTHNKKTHEIEYDIIINTIPIPEFLKIIKNIPKTYREKLEQVKYCPVVGCVIGTPKFLSKFYWHNVLERDVHMIVQHSMLYDGYKEKISWVSRYGGSEEDYDKPNNEIAEKYIRIVKEFFPGVEVKWHIVYKNLYATPIYERDYFKYMPRNRSPVDGLYQAGIATTYPKIRNMNTALESGIQVARMVERDISRA